MSRYGLAVVENGRAVYRRPSVPRRFKTYLAPDGAPVLAARRFFDPRARVYCWQAQQLNGYSVHCARGSGVAGAQGWSDIQIEAFFAAVDTDGIYVQAGGSRKRVAGP